MIFNLIDDQSRKDGKKLNFDMFGLMDLGKNSFNSDSDIFKHLSTQAKEYEGNLKKLKKSDDFKKMLGNLSVEAKENADQFLKSSSSTDILATKFSKASVDAAKMAKQTKLATVATKGLAFASNLLASAGIMLAVNVAIAGISAWVNKEEKLNEKILETKKCIKFSQ